MKMDPRSIGFFDSGMGGLSIALAARRALPEERFIYAGDCSHAPYGDRTPGFIQERSLKIASYLFGKAGVKALVIACNTATAEAADAIRSKFPDKIVIGVEPAIKPAAAYSKTGVIGMISTMRTAKSRRYAELIRHYAGSVRVISEGCPGLMERVELGDLDGPLTRKLCRQYLSGMLKEGIDALVLGCTHYPFLTKSISEITGPGVRLFVPDDAVAHHLKERLAQDSLLSEKNSGPDTFFISGLNEGREQTVRLLYPFKADFSELPV